MAGSLVVCNNEMVRTDAGERFRLPPVRKAARYDVFAGSPPGADYLPGGTRAADTEGLTPVRVGDRRLSPYRPAEPDPPPGGSGDALDLGAVTATPRGPGGD